MGPGSLWFHHLRTASLHPLHRPLAAHPPFTLWPPRPLPHTLPEGLQTLPEATRQTLSCPGQRQGPGCRGLSVAGARSPELNGYIQREWWPRRPQCWTVLPVSLEKAGGLIFLCLRSFALQSPSAPHTHRHTDTCARPTPTHTRAAPRQVALPGLSRKGWPWPLRLLWVVSSGGGNFRATLGVPGGSSQVRQQPRPSSH